VCTFEFLISATSCLELYNLGVSLDRLVDKIPTASAPGRGVHRRFLENVIASFKLAVAFEEGATFVFGSWICVADSVGNFHHYLMDTEKPETPAPTPRSNIDEFVDDLDKIQFPNPI
jgi:hypothetical protein